MSQQKMSPNPDLYSSFLKPSNSVCILKSFISDWGPSCWSIERLGNWFTNQEVSVKVGRPCIPGIVPKESHCLFEKWCLGDFSKLLLSYNDKNKFYYAAYNHFASFDNTSDKFEDFNWGWVGLCDRTSLQSTLWMGSEGSFTPCHKDSYGCNLHAQISGRKEWFLWPPDFDLNPTRVPYEESSIFASVDVFQKQYIDHALRIVVEPGEVIFIPRHWWHFVRSLDTSVSINTWIDLESDAQDRLKEAITRLLVCSLKSDSSQDTWVNPGETLSTPSENRGLLENALNHCSNPNFTASSKSDQYFVITKTETDHLIESFPIPKLSDDTVTHTDGNSKSIVDTLINCIVTDDHIMDIISEKLIKHMQNQ